MKKAGNVAITSSTSSCRKKSLNELSLSLVFSFWCLLFLFYSRFGRGHVSGDSYVGDGRSNRHWKELLLLDSNMSFPCHANNSTPLGCKNVGSQPHGSQQQVKGKNVSNGVTETKPSEQRGQPPQLPEKNTSCNATKPKAAESSCKSQTGLGEFRNKTMQGKGRGVHDPLGNIIHRLEPGGAEYNYASVARGSKVLSHNKEAKGAVNILVGDKDKYLRNPCSAEGKFVVIELSEETLVDVIEIANLEHYSSNFKDFELLGSLNYPAEEWILLGRFVAENVKHSQRFMLPEPKWVRYMRLNLITHYGMEFYCTLSNLEVYGVDAIERMLEDLIVVPDGSVATDKLVSSKLETDVKDKKVDPPIRDAANDHKAEGLLTDVPDPVKEVRQLPNGRVPADTVLKILMQKVRSLELNQTILEEYVNELNHRYGDALPDLTKELSQNSLLMERIRSEISNVLQWKEAMEKEIEELKSWKSTVSSQMDALVRENIFLRTNIEKMLSSQETLEKKELAVLAVSFFFSCFALFKMVVGRALLLLRSQEAEIHRTNSDWFFVLITTSMTTIIALLSS